MSLRKRLFGEEADDTPSPDGAASQGLLAAAMTADDGEVFDVADTERGGSARELTERLEAAWKSPDDLYAALSDGLAQGWPATMMLDAAERLRDIDAKGERSCTTYAAVLVSAGRFDEVERLLNGFMDLHGPTPGVLMQLATAYERQGKTGFAERSLWQAVQMAPNAPSVLEAWCRIQAALGRRERTALEGPAEVLGAWLPRMMLAELDIGSAREVAALEACQLVLAGVNDRDVPHALRVADRLAAVARERVGADAAEALAAFEREMARRAA